MKEWLKVNKIFFETIAAITLSFMAVFLSFQSNSISNKQSELLEIQTKIESQRTQPSFKVVMLSVYDEKTKKYLNDEIVIYRDNNESFSNLMVSSAIFVDVSHFVLGDQKTITFPLVGYYFAGYSEYSRVSDVPIYTLRGHMNNQKFQDLVAGFREILKRKKDNSVGSVDLRRYVKLEYQDIFGFQKVIYYRVSPVYGGEIISDDEGRRIFINYSNEMGEGYDLDKISPESLLKAIE